MLNKDSKDSKESHSTKNRNRVHDELEWFTNGFGRSKITEFAVSLNSLEAAIVSKALTELHGIALEQEQAVLFRKLNVIPSLIQLLENAWEDNIRVSSSFLLTELMKNDSLSAEQCFKYKLLKKMPGMLDSNNANVITASLMIMSCCLRTFHTSSKLTATEDIFLSGSIYRILRLFADDDNEMAEAAQGAAHLICNISFLPSFHNRLRDSGVINIVLPMLSQKPEFVVLGTILFNLSKSEGLLGSLRANRVYDVLERIVEESTNRSQRTVCLLTVANVFGSYDDHFQSRVLLQDKAVPDMLSDMLDATSTRGGRLFRMHMSMGGNEALPLPSVDSSGSGGVLGTRNSMSARDTRSATSAASGGAGVFSLRELTFSEVIYSIQAMSQSKECALMLAKAKIIPKLLDTIAVAMRKQHGNGDTLALTLICQTFFQLTQVPELIKTLQDNCVGSAVKQVLDLESPPRILLDAARMTLMALGDLDDPPANTAWMSMRVTGTKSRIPSDKPFVAFICHLRTDSQNFAVNRLHPALCLEGHSSFVDPDHRDSNKLDWKKVINNALNFIFVLSDNILVSEAHLMELSYAIDAGCCLHLVMADGSRWADVGGDKRHDFPPHSTISKLPERLRGVFTMKPLVYSPDHYGKFLIALLEKIRLPPPPKSDDPAAATGGGAGGGTGTEGDNGSGSNPNDPTKPAAAVGSAAGAQTVDRNGMPIADPNDSHAMAAAAMAAANGGGGGLGPMSFGGAAMQMLGGGAMGGASGGVQGASIHYNMWNNNPSMMNSLHSLSGAGAHGGAAAAAAA
eukprot:CAMPEP_0175040310 /NCGR_PEP_ID=MMETSP0052_2-20121109/1182_1 /TAXON_ID=51329 ORGANISM="Polytomella parva, Strain SAG 63-3" /NCGR_SAMPLE_ID=MMETSP0052_2 /ASSEMBLY_ACC=CAM_ASM_000194 /LENGTH=796 /DNA_ID=CAMNT_0016302487 /DNA_START=143 /DNA_END=2529 /DNA_ORIENTATION=-